MLLPVHQLKKLHHRGGNIKKETLKIYSKSDFFSKSIHLSVCSCLLHFKARSNSTDKKYIIKSGKWINTCVHQLVQLFPNTYKRTVKCFPRMV